MKKIIILVFTIMLLLSCSACESVNVNGALTDSVTYKNKYIGLGYIIPKDWRYYTDDELNKLSLQGLDAMRDDIAEQAKNIKIIYDMMAVSSNEEDTVAVVLERVPNKLDDMLFDDFLKATKDAYTYKGFENVVAEQTEISIDGRNYDALKVFGNLYGSEYYPVYSTVVYINCENYVVTLTANSVGEDTTDDILSRFFVLEN